jgi:hypothetical protein
MLKPKPVLIQKMASGDPTTLSYSTMSIAAFKVVRCDVFYCESFYPVINRDITPFPSFPSDTSKG